jgi:hypothetical protein
MNSGIGSGSRLCAPVITRATTFICIVVASTGIFLAGCTTDPALKGSRLVVTGRSAPFYKDGPAQDFDYPQPTFAVNQSEQESGPDFNLPRGAAVTLLKREFGYSHVMTSDGVAGYVANDQLVSAPGVVHSSAALDLPTSAALPNFRTSRRRAKSHPSVPPKERQEQLDLHDLPLPQPG